MDMGNSPSKAARLEGLLGRAAKIAVPGLWGLALLFLASHPRSEGATGEPGPGEFPPLCCAWHRGDGESRAFDLSQTERRYAEFKDSFSRSLSNSLTGRVVKGDLGGYELGLPACKRGSLRKAVPSRVPPRELRGRRLWFFSLHEGTPLRIPGGASEDQDLLPLACRAERVEDLAKASRLIGKRCSLAPKGLAEALGVRCIPAMVTITENGGVEIHEDP